MTVKARLIEGKVLKELSTFGIGGPARLFLEVATIDEMQEAILYCATTSLPYLVIGKGSNCLFDDRGYAGLIILNKISFCEEQPEGQFTVGAGYSFSLLGVQTARKRWSGLEFASGIPGSVGGAIYMNAGANGHETSEVLTHVSYVNEAGELERLAKSSLEFGYRFSSFQHMKGAIVSGHFQLSLSEDARQKQLAIVEYRMRTQPYGEPSVGCVFRNPVGNFAGAAIQQCGLKGAQIGGAKVSPIHANFIVNAGGGTAQDVLALASLIRATVKERIGLDLCMEIRYIPYEPT